MVVSLTSPSPSPGLLCRLQLGVKEEQEAVVRRELQKREQILKDKVGPVYTWKYMTLCIYMYMYI